MPPTITTSVLSIQQPDPATIFLGTFAKCDGVSPPKPFANGKSFSSCLTYLMPGDGSVQQMAWKNGPSKANAVTPCSEKPVVWAGA